MIFFLWLIQMVLDYSLVREIRKGIREKYKIHKKLIKLNCASFQATTAVKTNQQRIRNIEERTRDDETINKTNKIIIFNFVIYSLCRLPELVAQVIIYCLPFDNAIWFKCNYMVLCYILLNIIDNLYLISYIFNVYLYCKFNRKFRKNFLKFIKFT